MNANVELCSHPVVLHKLTQLRRVDTLSKNFRELMKEITMFLGYVATAKMGTRKLRVTTPLGMHEGVEMAEDVAIVPVLRSGLGMVDPMLDILPRAQVLHIGMYKDRKSLVPTLYYNKLPKECHVDQVIILEPVIATASTLSAVIDIIKEWGAENIDVISMLASQAGLENLFASHPSVKVHVAGIDQNVSDDGFIVPGVGDVGDRLFDTRGMKTGDQPPSPSKKRQRTDESS